MVFCHDKLSYLTHQHTIPKERKQAINLGGKINKCQIPILYVFSKRPLCQTEYSPWQPFGAVLPEL